MKSCLLCPKGTACRGYVLNTLIVKIYDAMTGTKSDDGQAAIGKILTQMTREDMELLAVQGDEARHTCWSKGFVMAMAFILARTIVRERVPDGALIMRMEQIISAMHTIFAKLPNGLKVKLSDLSMDVYNKTMENLQAAGSKSTVPANLFGQAYANVSKRQLQAAEAAKARAKAAG